MLKPDKASELLGGSLLPGNDVYLTFVVSPDASSEQVESTLKKLREAGYAAMVRLGVFGQEIVVMDRFDDQRIGFTRRETPRG